MNSSEAIARALWCIAAVLLLIAAANLQASRRTEPLLGLWDADLIERYRMPRQVPLDQRRIDELYRERPLVLVPTPEEVHANTSCRELFKFYGLDASRLERAARSGNPQSPCAAGQPIAIPLDSDR